MTPATGAIALATPGGATDAAHWNWPGRDGPGRLSSAWLWLSFLRPWRIFPQVPERKRGEGTNVSRGRNRYGHQENEESRQKESACQPGEIPRDARFRQDRRTQRRQGGGH